MEYNKISSINFFSLILAFVFVGCESYDNGYSENFIKYENTFENLYGKINSEQTWGFSDMPVANYVGGTRVSCPNSNEWSNYVVVPEEITEEESEYLRNYFSNQINPTSNCTIDYSSFFVQQVSGGNNAMNYLEVKLNDDVWEHVYNFNSSSGSIMLMQNSGTESFRYHNSTDNQNYENYVIKYLEFEAGGNSYSGFYLGFDYQDGNTEPDGCYNDWIVKITPAECLAPQGRAYDLRHDDHTRRIMCEDLGAVGVKDLDFNDLVFDVYYDQVAEGNYTAHITILAAGGTVPVYIGYGNKIVNVHELFGVPDSQPINVELRGDNCYGTRSVILENIPNTNPYTIDILVGNKGTAANVYLQSEKGSVPQKICVPSSTLWTKEGQNISWAYSLFESWVGSSNPNDYSWTDNVYDNYLYDGFNVTIDNSGVEEIVPPSETENVEEKQDPEYVTDNIVINQDDPYSVLFGRKLKLEVVNTHFAPCGITYALSGSSIPSVGNNGNYKITYVVEIANPYDSNSNYVGDNIKGASIAMMNWVTTDWSRYEPINIGTSTTSSTLYEVNGKKYAVVQMDIHLGKYQNKTQSGTKYNFDYIFLQADHINGQVVGAYINRM